PVLAVGRDGLMLPIRGEACYREGATATVSVHDRKGRRLGTVYLGRMPEPGQGTLSRQLTALIEDVLRQWNGPLPRLAYITDGGNHQTQYFRRVLKRMRHPRCPGQRLKWEWVIDYYGSSGGSVQALKKVDMLAQSNVASSTPFRLETQHVHQLVVPCVRDSGIHLHSDSLRWRNHPLCHRPGEKTVVLLG